MVYKIRQIFKIKNSTCKLQCQLMNCQQSNFLWIDVFKLSKINCVGGIIIHRAHLKRAKFVEKRDELRKEIDFMELPMYIYT